MTINNKRIIITGGTSGIGLELVHQLAANNELIIISRKGQLSDDLQQYTHKIKLYHCDLGKRQALENTVDQIQREFKHVDVLINNAAIQNTPRFTDNDFNYDGIQQEINVNLAAVCHLTYLLLPLLKQAEAGVILNVNSGLALAPKASSAVYCATKAALNTFSRSLAYQLENTSINVRQVFLPLVATPMTEGRGSNKLPAQAVAAEMISALKQTKDKRFISKFIGKAKILNILMRISPSLGYRLMRSY